MTYNLLINEVYWGEITHLLTVYILTSWDIQVGSMGNGIFTRSMGMVCTFKR